MIGSSLVATAAFLLLGFANASAIDFSALKRATDEPIINLDFPDPSILEDGSSCK